MVLHRQAQARDRWRLREVEPDLPIQVVAPVSIEPRLAARASTGASISQPSSAVRALLNRSPMRVVGARPAPFTVYPVLRSTQRTPAPTLFDAHRLIGWHRRGPEGDAATRSSRNAVSRALLDVAASGIWQDHPARATARSWRGGRRATPDTPGAFRVRFGVRRPEGGSAAPLERMRTRVCVGWSPFFISSAARDFGGSAARHEPWKRCSNASRETGARPRKNLSRLVGQPRALSRHAR